MVFPVAHGAIADASLEHARLHPHLAVHVNEDVSRLHTPMMITRHGRLEAISDGTITPRCHRPRIRVYQ